MGRPRDSLRTHPVFTGVGPPLSVLYFGDLLNNSFGGKKKDSDDRNQLKIFVN